MTAATLLDARRPAALARYLAGRGWLAPEERLRCVARAGEGNMNLALRVTTSARSVIVKQGRPWVERYPTIPAPAQRTVIEAKWYTLAGSVPALAARMPRLLGIDPDAHVLLLSDLGDAADYMHLYGGSRLRRGELDALVDWLSELHATFAGDPRAARLENREMRALNHEHIFQIPLREGNGLDLDAVMSGLGALAAGLRAHTELLDSVHRLGRRYLGDGTTLVHGDYYPGSWLQAPAPWVIDPEFGFYGPPEFDLGVMLAHLELAGQPPELSHQALCRYRHAAPVDERLTWGFAGVEVIRRLLGVAQLPLALDLAARRELIRRATERVRATP